MREETARLFDEFATAYRRGEAPDVLAYLERAGDEADALAALLDRFLQAVPARQPTEEELVLMDAGLEHEPPLLVLRRRRGLSRAAVVDAIVSALSLDRAKRDKVARYYHELEVGTLDPKPVSARVWEALGELLKANVRALAGLRPPPPSVPEALFRSTGDYRVRTLSARVDSLAEVSPVPSPDEDVVLPETAAAPPPSEPSEARDEIDRLFTGAS